MLLSFFCTGKPKDASHFVMPKKQKLFKVPLFKGDLGGSKR
ncbi:hypothetical protein MC7420_5164 [Coleofasciculus chthonoplastes PCC 7420]|uniref:Uncharacterized protein n=1 Tax=Coleofasciculus chthonoplastes PCC 7420 TaxID=118168 RepID=B4W2J4_9CYAN|nr:hypothetical protein MC7420_5164 [Coleofasciculus chthonoplastes PCC 7420]